VKVNVSKKWIEGLASDSIVSKMDEYLTLVRVSFKVMDENSV